MAFKYDNVTISGGIGVGKNTLFANLKYYLEPRGWRFRTTGQIIRDYTKENTMPVASLVSDDFHREIEKKALNILTNEKKWVIEAWLAGFIARDLKKVLKVLLVCSHDSIRIDRVANRDRLSVHEAIGNLKKREKDNFDLWHRIYGKHDYFDPKYYDLVIDTYSSGQLETTGKVLDKLGFDSKKIIIEEQ